MSFVRELLVNQWFLLCIKILAITFIGRFVLDAATSWTINERRSGVVVSVLTGWSAAVVFAAGLYASGLGVLAALVACTWHIVEILRERSAAMPG
jgi:hypothetical protein